MCASAFGNFARIQLRTEEYVDVLTRIARPVEIALGALFVVAAALKALNVYGFAVQVSAYGIVRGETLPITVAHAMISLEAVLGVALLAGFRLGGVVIAITGAMLVGLTGLIAYAWAFKGLADCGCFGDYVKMGPGASVAKNLALLFMTGIVWRGTQRDSNAAPAAEYADAPVPPPDVPGNNRRLVLAGLGTLLVVGAFLMGKPAPARLQISNIDKTAGPFAEFVPDLGGAPVPLAQGEFFVAMLSASCDHCRAVTQSLNDLTQTPGVPQIAALMLGTEEEMKDYMGATDPQFPIQTIEALKFFSLLADGVLHPPDFFIIRDGAIVRHLAAEEPTYEELLDFATKGEAPPAGDKK
jgi:hypothetical protein